ncbi:MAG: protein kinase [Luteolibacter sp.]|jgi:serine/threonine protein kinase/HEAT repeat protein|nr:protein kinase [Luteolibacter sp.]
MEERYEIRGKIGQGGLGAVYRGYDTRMNREVAIKRISRSSDDPELQEESTRQLVKEAGALASLQHPHIVTIYDVGKDDDGPYVVMELISGKTLEELIEHAPLTWPDFRELAMQTQEALIAAQELDLIHSDIKPSNLMLTWLPSGKFQLKIVDFGLATLTQSQSREELEELEAVFGSIFFMAPEQFERVPLDARSDLYSMGCVYYQALAGVYPFDGKTGQDVMQSHLNHSVKPLQELRADIPMWVCDWVMWQINRLPQDRPESARESLSVFLQNDKNPNPTMSLGSAQSSNNPKRPRLIIPGADPASAPVAIPGPPVPAAEIEPEVTQVTSVATPADAAPTGKLIKPTGKLIKPTGKLSKPTGKLLTPGSKLITAATKASPAAEPPPAAVEAPPAAVVEPEPLVSPNVGKTITAPQPLMPPEGSKPSVHTSSQVLPPAPEPAVIATQKLKARTPAPTLPPPRVGKRKLSNSSKTALAAILGLLVVLLGWYLLDRSGKNRETKLYNEMILEAAKGDATEVPVNSIKLELLLRNATNTGVVEQRQTIYKALFLAKATDSTDVDARIAEFATTQDMLPDVREVLIRDVLRKRKNPAVVPTLLAYASRSANDPRSAVAAMQAVRFMAGDEQFDKFLEVIEATQHDEVRKAAEETLAQIIKKSGNRAQYPPRLAAMHENSVDENVRHSTLRLLGRCGGPKATELVKKALDGTEEKDQVAAIISLGSWGDDSAFHLLTDFLASNPKEGLRDRAFDSAARFASDAEIAHAPESSQEQWTRLAAQAKTGAEQMKIVRGLVNYDEEWATKLLKQYSESEDDKVADLAEKALERINERKRLKGEN